MKNVPGRRGTRIPLGGLLLVVLWSGSAIVGAERLPAESEHWTTLTGAGLRCVVGDNAPWGPHRQGYNGLFRLRSDALGGSPFVDRYAGLNLEHYFDGRGRPDDRAVRFEPRIAPMTLRRLGPRAAELHQPPTPVFRIESRTRFELKRPNAVDMSFTCIPHEDVFEGGFFGVFWASYLSAPEDGSLYFLQAGSTLDKPIWRQFCTQRHGLHSTLRSETDHLKTVFKPPLGQSLYKSDSELRYAVPFFYGRHGDAVLIYIFEPGPVIRFSHSPDGGGRNDNANTPNPAWDFQLIVPDYKIGHACRLDMRLVYKPWAGRADVLAEVRRYLDERAKTRNVK